jgi:hypothetical protein
MSFQRQPDGSLLGCGPDADYPGKADAIAHWHRVRASFATHRAAAGTIRPDDRPLPSLVEQADRQIALRLKEIDEWRAIRDANRPGAQTTVANVSVTATFGLKGGAS